MRNASASAQNQTRHGALAGGSIERDDLRVEIVGKRHGRKKQYQSTAERNSSGECAGARSGTPAENPDTGENQRGAEPEQVEADLHHVVAAPSLCTVDFTLVYNYRRRDAILRRPCCG